MVHQKQIKKIESLLPLTMGGDRYTFRRELLRLKRANKDKPSGNYKKHIHILEERINTSIQKRNWRVSHAPEYDFNNDLPITDKKDEIVKSIVENPVVIISGETGSGKTTQIPKMCLSAGRGLDGIIGCTQPRRIAATSVAYRIAEEMNEKIGNSIGYKIRFKERIGQNSFIKVMTDGILLAETQTDPWLKRYDTIIVDEAHERSLNIDFILGILKNLLKKRTNLKLIITSATIDTEKFSNAFNQAPIIEVSGRMYPIKVKYFTGGLEQKKSRHSNEITHVDLAVQAVEKVFRENISGDILIFMPTEQDILETCVVLEGRYNRKVSVLPLFARLSAKEQGRVFRHNKKVRKIIVATNVAETSLTIPGIRYVVDTGLARISQYTPGSRITSLPVVPISKSSADQRKGRCGRVENGVCIRLFTEDDYQIRPVFTPPDILRSNLAEVILRMIALNLGDINVFPFIDRPAEKSVKDGFQLLKELGAIKEKTSPDKISKRFVLTKNGKLMAKIPIDPRLSRMLIEARDQNCLKELMIIAAALSIRDPRERPAEKAKEADQVHSGFTYPSSDFMTLINIWNQYHDTQKKFQSTHQLKKFCKTHFLSFKRMLEWRDIFSQIKILLKEFRIKEKTKPLKTDPEVIFERIHKSILSGFLSNVAVKKDKNIYRTAKGREAMIFPGSGLFNGAGQWVVSSELVETSRLFVRTVANIDSGWLEELGKDLCKYTYLNPNWERDQGEVVAKEQVSLFGLIVNEGRKVPFGPINPEEATRIFIRKALVENDLTQALPFMAHNQKLLDNIKHMEDKIRRRDILIGEEDIFQFYLERLPGVYSVSTLKKRLKKKRGDSFLHMNREDMLRYQPGEDLISQFPDHIKLGNNMLAAEYRFEPGKKSDGITVQVPQNIAPAISPEAVDWLVPGLFQEKITAMIKGLPKEYRKKLVPVADTVDIIEKEMPKTKKSLASALGHFIHTRFGLDIPSSAWPGDVLPDYLRMRISIIGPKGEEIKSSRDKSILLGQFEKKDKPVELMVAEKEWGREGIKKWDFGDLPDSIHVKIKENAGIKVYPGLEPHEDNARGINLKLFSNKFKAMESHKNGVAALYGFYFSKDLKFLNKNLVVPRELAGAVKYLGGSKELQKQLYDRVMKELFRKNIRKENEFYSYAEKTDAMIMQSGPKIMDKVVPVLKAYGETRSVLYHLETTNRNNSESIKFLNHLKNDLTRLIPSNFIHLYSRDRMVHLVRYLKAMMIRAQRALVNFEKDQTRAREIEKYEIHLKDFLSHLNEWTSEEKKVSIEEYFWMIEEFKVSLFAQELKTAIPVSSKRLNRKLNEIKRMV